MPASRLRALLPLGAALLLAAGVGPAAAAAVVPATTPVDPAALVPATTPVATPPVATAPAAAGPSTPIAAASDQDGPIPRAPTRKVSYAARLVVPVIVRASPSNKARRITRLAPYGSWNGGPVVLQIAAVEMVGRSRWLRVRLPIRPNGSTGWVRQASVEISVIRYRITVSRRQHRLTLFKDGFAVGSTRVVVGAPGTPSPVGHFAVLEVVRQPKGSELGPYALHLTAHSGVLDNYGGGPGRVALHGRSGPLLHDPLGTSRSHGCVRMPNAFIARLAKLAPEGTPVTIS